MFKEELRRAATWNEQYEEEREHEALIDEGDDDNNDKIL